MDIRACLACPLGEVRDGQLSGVSLTVTVVFQTVSDVGAIGRLLKVIGLFCRISSLLNVADI